jgi:Ca2+-binding RTX toxin-like protein
MPGNVITEGDRAMRSNQARFNHNIDGTGITIGIISDSFNALRDASKDVRAGELPGYNNPNQYFKPVRVLKDDSEGSDEGRAMAQIIHDIAPGAQLLFYGPRSVSDFARGIDTLVSAGADIIVDDLIFLNQPFFQDGPVSQAVARASRKNVAYVSAIGNYGNASYNSAFRPSGQRFSFGGLTYEAHDFDEGVETDVFQSITIPGLGALDIVFNWSEPFQSFGLGSGATIDLDLFLVSQPQFPQSSRDTVFVESALVNNVGNNPNEFLSLSNPSFRDRNYYLVIAKLQNGTPSADPELMKWIDLGGAGSIYEYVNEFPGQSANSTIYGHPNAAEAIAVGAVRFNHTPAFGRETITPRPFTSLGGTPILFDPNGNALRTPIIRKKPQLIAPDGVSTSVTGFKTFSGTSAAAPHLAAVIALMLERAGGAGRLSPAEILTVLQASTLDVGAPGFDASSGSGFIQAEAALINVAPTVKLTDGQKTLRGTPRADNLIGTPQKNRLIGRAGFDMVMGRAGHDRLKGNGGHDWLIGDEGRDVLLGNRGNDTLNGGNGRDRLRGGGAHDHLVGDRGNDDLLGGSGNDLLWGNGGRDRLRGQEGRDRFVIEKARGINIITDYQDRVDTLILADNLTFQQLTFRARGTNTVIKLGQNALARVVNIQPNQLTLDDIVEVDL